MENNELDKFLKGKLEEQSFEYNPEDWQNALKLIEKEEDRKRPLWIWWTAAGFALLLSAGLYLSTTYSNSNSTILADDKVEITDQKIRTDIKSKEASVHINQEEAQIEEALVSQVEERSTTGGSEIIKVQAEVIPKITSQETGYINLPDPISGNNPKLQPISSPVSESVADVRAGEDFSSQEVGNSTSQELELTKSFPSIVFIDRSYDRNGAFMLTSLNRLGAVSYEPKSFAWETPKAPLKIVPLADEAIKLGFGYGVSGYVNPYVANVDGSSNQITGFSGGISSLYRIDRTISLNADLLYTYRTGTFDVSNVSETKRYSFEALDAVSTLNPKALHYLSLPVYAGLHFGRHKVSLGGSLNYLGGVRGDVLDRTLDTQGNIIKESRQTGWILKDGFTTLNIGGMIGYDYAVTNRWNLSFRSNYLFNSIIDQSLSERLNSFIVKENSQVNIQIGSTYYFR